YNGLGRRNRQKTQPFFAAYSRGCTGAHEPRRIRRLPGHPLQLETLPCLTNSKRESSFFRTEAVLLLAISQRACGRSEECGKWVWPRRTPNPGGTACSHGVAAKLETLDSKSSAREYLDAGLEA